MNELMPCPFCGGEVEHQLMFDGAYSFTCSKCGLNARWTDDIARSVPDALEETERQWNTRYEQTCTAKISYDHVFNEYRILLSCGCEFYAEEPDDIMEYCPNCGRKVVKE